jgi:hypothetical protein
VRITDAQREVLNPHLTLKSDRALRSGRKPPMAVYAIVASLVKPESIEASIVEVSSYQTSGNQWTRWNVLLVTSTAFANVCLGFDAQSYDENEEKNLFGVKQKRTIDVIRAQVELLSDVVKTEFIPYEKEGNITIEQFNQGWLPVPCMKITLAVKTELYIPGQREVKSSEVEESEEFLAALRNHLPF